MKQSIISILLSLAVLVSLAACSAGPAGDAADPGGDPAESASQPIEDNTAEPSASAPEQTVGKDTFSFVTNGTEITVNENMAEVLVALGECQSYFEAESCAFDGLDKTYTYAGFVITTRPDGEQDFVNSIRLTDDSATTQEGVYIGSTADQVRAVYGDAEDDQEGALNYTNGDTMLSFILEDDAVISIEYLPA